MKNLYAFLLGAIMTIGVANAQAIDPNSMLGGEQQPETMPDDHDKSQGIQFVPLPLTANCLPMNAMKGLVEGIMGQESWVLGFNAMAAQQNSPFDGLVVARNPRTKEYTVLLIGSATDIACILAIGTRMELRSDTEIEQNNE